jgi:serine/threonine protein kinase
MELANGGNLEEFVLKRWVGKESSTEELSPKEIWKGRRRRLNSESAKQQKEEMLRRFLSVTEIWSFLLDICSGLEQLHQHGIIHRDLKPSSNTRTIPIATILF